MTDLEAALNVIVERMGWFNLQDARDDMDLIDGCRDCEHDIAILRRAEIFKDDSDA